MLYQVNNDMTYVHSDRVKKNVFINMQPENEPLPSYEESKDRLPKPIWDGHEATTMHGKSHLEISAVRMEMPDLYQISLIQRSTDFCLCGIHHL